GVAAQGLVASPVEELVSRDSQLGDEPESLLEPEQLDLVHVLCRVGQVKAARALQILELLLVPAGRLCHSRLSTLKVAGFTGSEDLQEAQPSVSQAVPQPEKGSEVLPSLVHGALITDSVHRQSLYVEGAEAVAMHREVADLGRRSLECG